MHATAIAHPNIALIKYWGKADVERNTPATPSLSVTLAGLQTRTRVELSTAFDRDRVIFDGAEQQQPDARIIGCLDRMRQLAGTQLRARIETGNDFPTAAGLASSASGFAALVTALDGALGLHLSAPARAEQARLASASAARSIHGGFVALDSTTRTPDGGWAPRPIADCTYWPLAVVVAVCATGRKAVGSGAGMRHSAATSPLYRRWLETAPDDFADALAAVATRDFDRLAARSEANCLKMHAVMMTTLPPLLYCTGATVECMHVVRQLRRTGLPVFFTVDAGPQVKVFCEPEAHERVREALGAVPGVQATLWAGVGQGARLVSDGQGAEVRE
jgi:diphosphomevalonate decarboxylase